MKFLGIDLGWSSGATGLCCLAWQDNQLQLHELNHLDAIAAILAWVDAQLPAAAPGMVAVDAPTLIPNATGMRLPDRLTHQHFRQYHAGCYPANLGRPFAQRTIAFGLSLETRGFVHAPEITPRQPGRYQIEVFPHPAIVHLFRLNRILKYKKGKLSDRRQELLKLRHLLFTQLPALEPRLILDSVDLPEIPTTGISLKAVEDQLDSLVCAYVAAYWWYWGTKRTWILGDRSTGYIVVPAPLPASHEKNFP